MNCNFVSLLIVAVSVLFLYSFANAEGQSLTRGVISKNDFWRDCDLDTEDNLNIVVQEKVLRIPFGYLPVSENWKFHLCKDRDHLFYNKVTPPDIDIELKNGDIVNNYSRFLQNLLRYEEDISIARISVSSELVNSHGYDGIGSRTNPWLGGVDCHKLDIGNNNIVDSRNRRFSENLIECNKYKLISKKIIMRQRLCGWEEPIVCTVDFFDMNSKLARVKARRIDIPIAHKNILNIIGLFQSWKIE